MKQGIVFDMDKCIGFFTQVAVFHDILEELSRPLKTNEYFDLFDMCPEIFRPGIFKVFAYLSNVKNKTNSEVIMYTNNNGPPSWATNIRKYIEYKIKKKIFDRTIKGWKYNNKIIEKKRDGYAKSWKDLLKCTRLNKNDKIIFFDDREEHDQMKHRNINYQLVKPYKVKIEYKTFINRFMKSKLKKKLGNKITKDKLESALFDDGYEPKVLSKKYSNDDIMKPLREFMKLNRKKTRRQRKRQRKRTRKGGKHTKCRRTNNTRAPTVLSETDTQDFVNILRPNEHRRLMRHIRGQRHIMNRRNIDEERQDAITADWLEHQNQIYRTRLQRRIAEDRTLGELTRRVQEQLDQIEEDGARQREEATIAQENDVIRVTIPRNINDPTD